MIIFKLEKGNHKDTFKELSLTDANGMFELVELAQEKIAAKDRKITQWQNGEYTYINYGHSTDFFRYVAIDLRNTEEKEDQ